ncbi:hypothetical protein L3Q72_04180 [Vibrio sp. JC009]|uniref:hypothetical protein n=1 Tax=Vibrio sp. JC009 TaxID=2912314 RepID=UPI0023B1C74F|nr:hypothetical protein [Vibrio sp. JC009]WED22602.1 hypothetical protein L3Q72_04180 [Vibrio sp. JC009]
MLKVSVLILAIVIAAIFGIYYYRANQQKKASRARMKKRLAHVERIKSGFLADLQRLSELGVLSEQGQEAIYRLASYFFVLQPASPENVEQCEAIMKGLLMAIRDKMQDAENNNPVFLRIQLDDFAKSLPRKATGYNAGFYRNELPLLIQKFVDAQGVTVKEINTLQDYFR